MASRELRELHVSQVAPVEKVALAMVQSLRAVVAVEAMVVIAGILVG